MQALAGKGYDVKSIYSTVKSISVGEALIPLKKRRTKTKTLSFGNPICEAGLSMHKDGKVTDNGRTRQKFCCPLRQSKHGVCPCNKKMGATERKTGAAPNAEHSSPTTGFPLIVPVSISRGLTPCTRNAGDKIPVLRHLDRRDYGCATAPVQQISIHLPTPSLLWLLHYPLS